MCGIFGYLGKEDSYKIVKEGLERLSYRGYDSAGIISVKKSKFIERKCVGRPDRLSGSGPKSRLSIGHNRWATHGAPTILNSHPHVSNDGKIALVHNGIIENYADLKIHLQSEGFSFYSETDSELIPNLIQFYSKVLSLDEAIVAALKVIRGAYAIVFVHLDYPNKIFAARLGSPVCIGKDAKENIYISSDFGSLPSEANNVITMSDNRVASIELGGAINVTSLDGESVEAIFEKVDLEGASYSLGNFDHFLQKEIFEQSDYVRNALTGRVGKDDIKLAGISGSIGKILHATEIIYTGCGSAFLAAQIGAFAMETIARKRVRVMPAGELKYYNAVIDSGTVLVSVSQSGETADTIGCIKTFKKHGAHTIGVVNVPNSTISKMVDSGIYIRAGKEISVASTKAVINQIITMVSMAAMIGSKRDFSALTYEEFIKELKLIPNRIDRITSNAKHIEDLAKKYSNYENMLFIGRGINEMVAKEAALKVKEISYIHAEGYSAAELKHGPLALVCQNMPTIAIVQSGAIEEKMISNIREVKARGGIVVGIIEDACSDELRRILDDIIEVPSCKFESLRSVTLLIPCQLFSYYLAKERNCAIDMPRNLAKSVSVE